MYMAPEQYGAASEVTGEADVFAVGAVFSKCSREASVW